MHDPDMIARVNGDADHGTDDPAIGQRPGPRRIDTIGRRLRRLLVATQRGRQRRNGEVHQGRPHHVTSLAHSPRRINASASPPGSTPSTFTSLDPIMKSTWMALRLPPARSNSSSLIASAPESVNLYAEPRATWLAAFSSNSVV